MTPTLADIRSAAARIEGRVIRTPLRRSSWLSGITGGDVYLKIETIQPTFSYKIRGAFNAVQSLIEQERRGPLVTASAGNHGRALAHAANAAGLQLTVYAPAGAPRTKLEAIRALGAELRECSDYDEAERQAKAHGASGDALYISPYSHPDVIAGAGTVALEILDDQPDIHTIVVPIGGGGLISGIAIATHELQPSVRVIGVEVEASHPFTEGLAAGRIVTIDVGQTLADGLSGNLDPDTITFDIVRTHVQRIALVGEPELESAIAGLVREERLVTEGAGAAAAAAVAAKRVDLSGRRTAVIVSGGNIDSDKLRKLI